MELAPQPENTILLVEVGSTAHGTGMEGTEDYDLICVYVEEPHDVFGLDVRASGRPNRMSRTQPEGSRSGPGDTDRQEYSLRSFLRLAAQGNPSILLALWAPVVSASPLGLSLRALGPGFVGRHIIPKYRGYMEGQALRLLGIAGGRHGRRGGGGREELISAFGFDTKYAMHCARLGFQCRELLTTGQLVLPVAGEPGAWLRAVRHGEVPFQEWWDRTLALDAELESLASDERIRPGAGLPDLEAWSARAHRQVWGWHR